MKTKAEKRSSQKSGSAKNARHDSAAHSVVTPTTGKKIAVVEIPSSGSCKVSKVQKVSNNVSKVDRRIQLLEEMERDTNTGKHVILPIKPKRRRAKSNKATASFSSSEKGLISLAEISRPGVSQSISEQRGRLNKKLSEPQIGFHHEVESTPSPAKKRTPKSNNVALNESKELDFGFKDLPNIVHDDGGSSKLQFAKNAPINKPAGHLGDKEDDTACEVCGRYFSKKKNPMLLCDGCDSGYHILCIGLSKEPESEQWFCQNCERGVVQGHHNESAPLQSSGPVPEIENFEYHLQHQQRIIFDKLTGRERLKLKGLDEEMQKVHQVVEQTVLAGESNSMMIIGSRGTGKTAVCFKEIYFQLYFF